MNLNKFTGKLKNKVLVSWKPSPRALIRSKFVVGLTDLLPKPVKQKVKQLILHNNLLRSVYYKSFKPTRTQRVYLKKGTEPIKFLEILNQRGIMYVLLRWWENLPDFPPGEDINILVKDEHRDLINDLVSLSDKRGVKCDIYTVSGVKNGSRFGVPVFPFELTQALLTKRVFFNGAYVPSPFLNFASVAYHAIFHKGHDSGVPGFGIEPTSYVYDYTTKLKELALNLGIEVEVTVAGLFEWLKKERFTPAEDTLTKLVMNMPELSILQSRLFSDARGGEVLVYLVRERLMQERLLDDFKSFLEDKYQFDLLDVRILSTEEKEICTTQIRGGNWGKGPFKSSGGPPVALVVAYDYHPKPLSENEQKKQPRTTNRNSLNAKYGYRERLFNLISSKDNYNGVHSADNEQDAWFYITLLGDDYRDRISAEVEIRRNRYSRKWGVKKVLSIGPTSKVELIKYGEKLAVKKTFRPGKEKFFERELFAVKELSKELSFIPPLWEEGDGYFVIPFLENVLEVLPEKEKMQIISSKKIRLWR